MEYSLNQGSSSRPVGKRFIGTVGKELLLLICSALLFALSFPSIVSRWGWFPLAYFSLIPIFIVIHRASWLRTVLYGVFFGLISYGLHNFWLGSFHPLTLIIVPAIHSGYFILIFPILKAVDRFFPRYGYFLQSLIWVCYEFLKVQGFLAYAYGIIGYSQYSFLPFIRIAGLTGVWGVSLLVVFPSALLGNALKEGLSSFLPFLKEMRLSILLYVVLFSAVLLYGFLNVSSLGNSRQWKVALIQHNVDPWKGGNKAYEKSFNVLTRLSRLAAREDPDIIIWSETSFVPAIDWHTRYRTDRTAYKLVKRLREFLSEQEQPYVIGNDDGQLVRTEFGQEIRVDYNAAILFHNGEIINTYRKLHLVPATEYFPYKNIFPGIYEWLRNADTHFWEEGKEFTVFEADRVKFSTPICFEDTFGYLCRELIRQGAEVLVNMTNDSWSNSVASEMQHMSISVFRAVENKRSLVRATNGGITCVIDPNGRIIDLLEPFTEAYLIASVPVYTEVFTLYTRWGDWFAHLILVLSVLGFLGGIVMRLLGSGRQGAKKGLTREDKFRKMKKSRV